MVFEIEELLNHYVNLGDRLEDQAVRLADKESEELSVGRNDLESGQEAMIRARIKSGKMSAFASRGGESGQESMDINHLRAELAMLESSQNEHDARDSASPTSPARASQSLFGSLSPATARGFGASASSTFFRQLPSAGDVVSGAPSGGLTPRTPGGAYQQMPGSPLTVPSSPRLTLSNVGGGSRSMRMPSAVNQVRNALRLQNAGRMTALDTSSRLGSASPRTSDDRTARAA